MVPQPWDVDENPEVLLDPRLVILEHAPGHCALLTTRLCSRLNTTPASRDNVREPQEFALTHVDQDKESEDI